MTVAAVSLGDADAEVGQHILKELRLLVSPCRGNCTEMKIPVTTTAALTSANSGSDMTQLRTTTATIQGLPNLQSSSADMRRKGASRVN
jgi:hypothetical protein